MKLFLISYLATVANANVYFHSPRGSNNRLNENSAENKNFKRLFSSNNNRRGGYNVGDLTDDAFSDEDGQYNMKYFQSGSEGESYLTLEWTSLLGCGVDEDGDKIHNCDIVIQKNCQSDDFEGVPPADSYTIRNGRTTDTIPFTKDPNTAYNPDGRCFIDSGQRDMPHRLPNIPHNAENSIEYCRAACGEAGYLYAGIQYTSECWCDDSFGSLGEAPLEQCNHNCRDNSGNKCGGPWRQNVYLSLVDVSSKTLEVSTNTKEVEDDNIPYDDYEGENDDYQDDYGKSQYSEYITEDEDPKYENDKDDDETDEPEIVEVNNETNEEAPTLNSEKDCGGGGLRGIASRIFSPKDRSSGRRALNIEMENQGDKNARRSSSEDDQFGLHEPWEYFERCGATIGTRYGMECHEEREVWPDNSISPWVDVAYLTDDKANNCTEEIENLNSREFFECVEYYETDENFRRHKSTYKNETDCMANGGDWLGFYKVGDIINDIDSPDDCGALNNNGGHEYVWGRPMNWQDLAEDIVSAQTCIALPAKTQCLAAPVTRSGYLGSVNNEHHTPRFHWTLPNYNEDKRCVLRIRYIVSVQAEPITDSNKFFYLENNDGLALAKTENRTVFEDRSHVFKLVQREDMIPDDLNIHNLVVRGKRGNIVQTYPAVEYDFVPNRLTIPYGEAVHVQWTGSNTHNNGHPGGDGQTGDAGEGRGGTDRNNFIQLLNRKANLVAPDHNHTLFQDAEWVWSSHEMGNVTNKGFNLALSMATSGYYHCETEDECEKHFDNSLNDQLNNAPASYYGNVFKPAIGEFHYKCMRNDNFSNRAQKGTITVMPM